MRVKFEQLGGPDRLRFHNGCPFREFPCGHSHGEKLNTPIAEGNISVTILQLSNVAWEVNRELNLDTSNGHIQDDAEATKFWDREYEKGWEAHV